MHNELTWKKIITISAVVCGIMAIVPNLLAGKPVQAETNSEATASMTLIPCTTDADCVAKNGGDF